MVLLAHIKQQSRLSLGSYGRPRMTEELKELGLYVGHRRVGRLMRENGIRVERSKKDVSIGAGLKRKQKVPRLRADKEAGAKAGDATHRHGHHKGATAGLIVGVVVMMFLDVVFG